ncbi:PEP-CTERM sorting domain-containing protein [Desulfogranum mediterraneum]|uniref:PEP-CTERM sorting domain-containing protein n=1 Tax=Desulfogranum mediterraneum TaxID=160661 RepID=UPI00040A741B|nr:PEP-CTERM sorting domain-containing protein [Desulfogranum mediterraneum]
MKAVQIVMAATLIALSCVASGYALPVSGDSVTFKDGIGSTSGGEFQATVTDNSGKSETYITFCLEKNEYINFSSEYTVTNVSDAAEAGGIGGATGGMDPVEDATKWVFWNYLQGTFGAKSTTLANQVQKTIWQLEGEINWFGNDTFFKNVMNQADYSIQGGVVKVMNIERNGKPAQSQLFAAPVPEPATTLLFGIGLAAFTGISRRRGKRD